MIKGMIFAAGIGSRLKPFTDNHPKALAKVGGVPMLARVIERMKAIGITEIVVNVHHFAEQIIHYLKANDNFGVKIHISDETDLLLDTGGGLLKAREFLSDADAILLHNVDVMSTIDLRRIVDAQLSNTRLSTLSVASRQTSRYLYFDDSLKLIGWQNEKTGESAPAEFRPLPFNLKYAFSGIHAVAPCIFPLLSQYARSYGEKFSLTPFYLEHCVAEDIVGDVMHADEQWLDIGNPAALSAAQNLY